MLSKDDTQYIAHLSRIHLKDKEIDRLSKDLGDILSYIEKLNELDVSKIKPTSHVLPLKNVYRKDVVTPSLSQEDVMKFAKEPLEGSFKVPKVIE